MAETKFTTSFIPKKPIQSVSKGGKIKRKKGSDLLVLISFVIFIAMIVAAVGAFLYEKKLQRDITLQKQNLEEVSQSLNQQFISEAVRLNDRINGVQNLLDKHLSPSQVFFLLEKYTISTLRFGNLSFSVSPDGNLLLQGSGTAVGFESIIQQSDAYGQSKFLRDIIFSNLQNNQEGLVNFSFQSTVDPLLINYRETLFSDGGTFESVNNNQAEPEQSEQQILEETSQNNQQSDSNNGLGDGFTLEQELINEEQ